MLAAITAVIWATLFSHDHQAVARQEAGRPEKVGKRRRCLVELGVAPCPPVFHERWMLRQSRQVSANQMMEPEVTWRWIDFHDWMR
jgi:hypothetical protein